MVKLNSKHLMFLICGVSIVSMKMYPTVFTISGGQDTWIAIVIACILSLCFVSFIMWAASKTGVYSLPNLLIRTFGKGLGGLFVALYLIALLLTMFESSSVEANALMSHFFIQRVSWSFLAIWILGSVYVVKKGGASIVTTSLITITLICISGILLAILTQKYKEIKYLFPIMADGVTPGFVQALLKALGALGCVGIVFPFLNGIEDKGKLRKHSVWAMVFVSQVEIVSIIGVLTTFGVNRINDLIYPKLTQTQQVSYFGFLEFGELFVMLQVVAGWFLKFCITLYAFQETLSQIGFRRRSIIYIAAALTFGISVYLTDRQMLLFESLHVLLYIQLAVFVCVPLLAYSICLARQKLREKNASAREDPREEEYAGSQIV